MALPIAAILARLLAAGGGRAAVGGAAAAEGRVLTSVGANNAKAYTQALMGAAEGVPPRRRRRRRSADDGSEQQDSGGSENTEGQSPLAGSAMRAAKAVSLLGAAAFTATAATAKLSNMLLDSQRTLGRWHGGIAATMAQMDLQRMQLEMQRARNTAGSVQALGRATMGLNETLQPIKEDFAILQNMVMAGLTRLVDIGLETLGKLPGVGDLHNLIQEWDRRMRREQGMPLAEAIGRVAWSEYGGRMPRPPYNIEPDL